MKSIQKDLTFVDELGRRFASLDIDIMVENGEKFFTTFRYTSRVSLDFPSGNWMICCDYLDDQFLERYPSLRKRKDVRICLNDAKVVKQDNKVQRYEKDRKFFRSSSEFEKRSLRFKA